MDADAEPVHGMAVNGQGVEHGSKAVGDRTSGAHVRLESPRLLGGGEFFVEEQIHDVFG